MLSPHLIRDQNQTVWPAFQAASDTLHRDGAWPSQLAEKSIWRRSGGLPARPCRRRALPRLRGLGARSAGAPGARAGAQSGLPRAASSARSCSPGEDLAGEPTQDSRLGARTLHTPLSGGSGGGKPGWVRGGILRPAPTTDWPRLRKLAGEGSVAGGIQAVSGPGTQGQSGSLPVARLSQEARMA